jgi:hypothetical protein
VVANGAAGSLIDCYTAITGDIDEDKWTGPFAGAQPYGEGLDKRIANAPGLRTDRIRAPVLAHQKLIVDWFDFWLNGRENPSTEKLDQYRRWPS